MSAIHIPEILVKNFADEPEGAAALARLPDVIAELTERWSLTLGDPIEAEATCSWVAPCTRSDGSDAVLKIAMPHMEARDECAGLIFWDGDPTVRVLESEPEHWAMLLERCVPGTTLREHPEVEQDEVIAGLLKRLWRKPPPTEVESHDFRTLTEMLAHWRDEALLKPPEHWPDYGLTLAGLRLYDELRAPTPHDALLATDLHAGNVLAAHDSSRGEPWIVIDPKPFIGDPTYDATQHLMNCHERLFMDPMSIIARFADLLGVDYARLRLWMFARLAANSMGDVQKTQTLARLVGTGG